MAVFDLAYARAYARRDWARHRDSPASIVRSSVSRTESASKNLPGLAQGHRFGQRVADREAASVQTGEISALSER